MRSSDVSLSQRARTTVVFLRLGFPLVGVFLLTLGLLGMFSYGLLPLADAWQVRHWQPVAASIEQLALRREGSLLHPPLDSVEVVFRYRFGDVEYVGRRLDPHDGRFPRSRGDAAIKQLRQQTEAVAWVNPAEPAEAMLVRELRWGVLAFALPALAMTVAGAMLLFAGMLAWNNIATLRPQARSQPHHEV